MNLIERFKAETPKVWKWVIGFSCTLKAVCLTIMNFNLPVSLPPQATTYAGWALFGCVAITTFAAGQVKKEEK